MLTTAFRLLKSLHEIERFVKRFEINVYKEGIEKMAHKLRGGAYVPK